MTSNETNLQRRQKG